MPKSRPWDLNRGFRLKNFARFVVFPYRSKPVAANESCSSLFMVKVYHRRIDLQQICATAAVVAGLRQAQGDTMTAWASVMNKASPPAKQSFGVPRKGGMERIETSPRLLARITGALYLLLIVGGVWAESAIGSLIVSGNTAATLQNIHGSESLYRMAAATELAGGAAYVAITALLYRLLAGVNKTIALLATALSLVGCVLWTLGPIFQLVVLSVGQNDALSGLLIKLRGEMLFATWLFFGPYCLLIGYLIFQSRFLPRTVGMLLIVAGICDVINVLCGVISPPFSHAMSAFIDLPALLGEGALTLWLLIVGLNEEKFYA